MVNGLAVVPGQCRDPGPGPANPRDWHRDRDSKPRDSDKICGTVPVLKSRHIGIRIDRDMNRLHHIGTSGDGTKFRGTVLHGCPAGHAAPG